MTGHPAAPASGTAPADPADAVPGDLAMIRALWPVLLASAAGLLPFTVFGTFLVPIAEGADETVAAVGGLRGLGGLAALAVGVALAPLIDRLPKEWTAAAGLLLLGLSSALGATGSFLALTAFCLLVGAATSMLNPALTAAAADRFGSGGAAGRAATLVTATQSLTAMLAAPVIALPALVWGWQGTLSAVAAASLLLGALFLVRRRSAARAAERPRIGYLATFRALLAIPGAVPLLLIAFLRTAAFMGYLAYLAAFYDARFGLTPEVFALVWTLSGGSFFVGNYLSGRLANAAPPRIGTEALLTLGLVLAAASTLGFAFTTSLPLALALTALQAVGHAVVAACVVSLLVRRSGELRGSALAVNAAGMSLGVFAGAALGGAGLAAAGLTGAGTALGCCVLAALVASRWVRPAR
ncbi:putative MFS family arabinose efflux permease [Murinocardiopsis flavida]|uniref:Putative MFS family arabinose efflux permease n=1 Tax=Murinocardiopsis flavida TaxID=645275 RepID=A0A2P8DMK3_9ACTN|nr:MFS transporter [Murinocardiopsis flavida]PSK98445.1 putative MFS family arabinose efflux permease [Murinocardiopsis flavida]